MDDVLTEKQMDTRAIVKKAWQITQVHLKKLIWYGAIPAFLGTMVYGAYAVYQYHALTESAVFNPNKTVDVLGSVYTSWDFITGHFTLSITLGILGLIVLGLNFVLPPIMKGALIQALSKINDFQPIAGSFEVGIRRFFPMLEFAFLTGSFSILTIFTESSFILRWWGQEVLLLALPILLFIGVVGLIASFLFTYSEYFIVLKKEAIIKSITESAVLVLANFRKTILIFILILLIGARAILNVLLILFIPAIAMFLTIHFAHLFMTTIGFIIIGIISLLILLLSSYLMGLFSVFATAVWVLSFTELTQPKE